MLAYLHDRERRTKRRGRRDDPAWLNNHGGPLIPPRWTTWFVAGSSGWMYLSRLGRRVRVPPYRGDATGGTWRDGQRRASASRSRLAELDADLYPRHGPLGARGRAWLAPSGGSCSLCPAEEWDSNTEQW